MAKDKPKALGEEEKGAPAALARLETEELKCYQRKQELEHQLDNLPEPSLNATTEQHELWATQKTRLESDLLFAFKRWDVAVKSLREYHEKIKPSEREGEKLLVSDAKEIFAQYQLSIDLAIEQTIIADAQSAALADSPEAFHVAHAANYRAAKEGAITAAKGDGVLPSWLAI